MMIKTILLNPLLMLALNMDLVLAIVSSDLPFGLECKHTQSSVPTLLPFYGPFFSESSGVDDVLRKTFKKHY